MKELSGTYNEIEFVKNDSGETVGQAYRLPKICGEQAERVSYNDHGEITRRAFPLIAARGQALHRLADATGVAHETAARRAFPG